MKYFIILAFAVGFIPCYGQTKFSILADVGTGYHLGKLRSEFPSPNGKNFNTYTQAWGSPLLRFSVAPGISFNNLFIGPEINVNYQFSGNISDYVETSFSVKARQKIGHKTVRPLIDISVGYASLKYNFTYNNDASKRRGFIIEPGIGVSIGKNSAAVIRLNYRLEVLRHKNPITFTDNVGNPIGTGRAIDYMNYLLLSVGFQLR